MTLDNWAAITEEVQPIYPWAWVLFLAFIIVTTFIFGSLIIGSMCEAVSAASNENVWKPWSDTRSNQSNINIVEKNDVDTHRLERRIKELTQAVQRLTELQLAMQERYQQPTKEEDL
jgi:voltage-gated sodium channel